VAAPIVNQLTQIKPTEASNWFQRFCNRLLLLPFDAARFCANQIAQKFPSVANMISVK
jgi:hypothetical protein